MALSEPSHEKELKHIRIIQKHETETNWNKATKFIPKLGEVIIYDPDANHTTSRIKIGDGTTVVANLPFVQQGFIDSELSNTSENAVQNKVIKSELDKKQDFLMLKSEATTDTMTISPLIITDSSTKSVALQDFTLIQGETLAGTIGSFESAIETPAIAHSYPDGNGYTQINIDDVGSITFSAVNNDNEDTVILSGISEPTFDTDAANKSYVDTEVAKNKITVDTALSSTSINPVQNKVVNTALAGKANASHTHNLNDVTIKTAFNTTGSVDYISRSLVPYISGTKFYGMPAAAITVEYSRDAGATWIDYGLDDSTKMRIFDHSGVSLYLGKASTKADNSINNMLRITIDATKSDGRYLSTDSMFTWMSSSGNTTCVTLEVASYNAPTTFRTIVDNAPINGWSGPNMSHYGSITFGGSTAGSNSPNNQFYRLTYKQTAINSNYSSALISDIRFFGSTLWGGGTTISTNMLKQGAPYSVRLDSDGQAGTVRFSKLGAAFGNGTAADGKYSLAGGINAIVNHEGSIAYGRNLNTSAQYQAIFGRYNAINSSALLQVGNGSSAGVKTAFSVFNDGHAEVQTQGTTDNSVVIKSELPTIITF